MPFGPRRLFIHVAALGLLARGFAAWAQSACTPSPQCRRDCGPTHPATEGPFYVANAPELVDINPARAQGTTMRIEGTVYSQDAVTPIRAARVEIWHADALGASLVGLAVDRRDRIWLKAIDQNEKTLPGLWERRRLTRDEDRGRGPHRGDV